MLGSSISFQDYPLEQAIDILAGLGFTRVEMWKHHLRRCKTRDLRQRFIGFAESKGLSMGGLNVVGEEYYRPFGTEEEFRKTLDGLRADVDYAYSLGAGDVLVWEGIRPSGFSNQQCMERLLPRLTELFQEAIAYSRPKSIRFLVEPHPFTVGMSDPFLIALCDSLPSEFFGITFDFCHYGVGRSQDYVAAVKNLGHRIRHIHFSDSDLESSELHFVPGDGRMDIEALLRAFSDIGYRESMALDLYANPTPIDGARRAVPMIAEAMRRLQCQP